MTTKGRIYWHCTAETPTPADWTDRVMHEECAEVEDSQRDGWPGGDTVTKRCKNCKREWTEELPQ